MGNRAVLAIGSEQSAKFGIYLHWNGGRPSVEGLLDATRELMKDRGPDAIYGPARLVQVIGNFMGGTLSLGLGALDELDCDNGDNGVYYIDPESLQIIGRKFAPPTEQAKDGYREGVRDCAIKQSKEPFTREERERAKRAAKAVQS